MTESTLTNPRSDGAPILHFENLHMIFRRRFKKPVYALRGLSLSINQGAVVGLLGPNGSGKTTAISCALGLLMPQVGDVHLWERKVGPGRNAAGTRFKKFPPPVALERNYHSFFSFHDRGTGHGKGNMETNPVYYQHRNSKDNLVAQVRNFKYVKHRSKHFYIFC